MPRRARPWYRQGRSMWFVQVNGRQHPLGITDPNDRAGADAAHARLVEQLAAAVAAKITPPGSVPGTVPSPVTQTVRDAVTGFLAAATKRAERGKVKPKTVADYRLAMNAFTATFGSRSLADLITEAGREEIEEWADRPEWSQSTRNTYLGTVQTLFKWAGLRLRIHRPPKGSRGADTCLTDEQFAEVLQAACRGRFGGDLRQLLRVLRETGARPGEISPLTVEGIDWPNACTRLREHKTRRHTGRDRVIHFTSAAMAILTAQRDRYQTGLLFRTRYDRAYRAATIVRRLGQVSERVGYRVIAYGLGRHSFASRALAAGVPDTVVAGLLGHTGTTMLHRHYSHIGENARLLQEAAERVSQRSRKPA